MNKITIQNVSTKNCGSCIAALEILKRIKLSFPAITIEYVDIMSTKGQKMVIKYQIMSSPGIIINGILFSTGGLNESQLIKKIQELST